MKIINKSLVSALAIAVVVAFFPTQASAHVYLPYHSYKSEKFHHFHKFHKFKEAGKASSSSNRDPGSSSHHRNGLSGAQGYVGAAMFCSAIWLIAHAAYVSRTENRELTRREAYMDVAGCWLPIVGPLLVDQYLPKQYY